MQGAHDRGLLAGIARYVRDHEPWSLTIASQWLHQPQGVLSWRGHGLIGHLSLPPIPGLVAGLGIPAVSISEAVEHLPFPSVITDSNTVGELAAQHLLDVGCTNFAYWGPSTHHHFVARGRAFAKTPRRRRLRLHLGSATARPLRSERASGGPHRLDREPSQTRGHLYLQ